MTSSKLPTADAAVPQARPYMRMLSPGSANLGGSRAVSDRMVGLNKLTDIICLAVNFFLGHMVYKSKIFYNFVNLKDKNMDNRFKIRLKQARVMNGFSMDELCKRTGNSISKQAIYKYEQGKMLPNGSVLVALADALGVKIDYFFRPLSVSIDNVEFSHGEKLGAKQIASIKEIVKDQLERYFEIEALSQIECDSEVVMRYKLSGTSDVKLVAKYFRDKWKLGDDGINNLLELLENNGIKVVEIDAPYEFDALSGMVNHNKPFIVLNANLKPEDKRFAALHELAHLTIAFDPGLTKSQIEHLCNQFASEMLIGSYELKSLLGDKRKDISLSELFDIQQQYGISIENLIAKAKDLGIISPNRHNVFKEKLADNASFRELVTKSRILPEQSGRFARLVYKALANQIISISKAAALLNIPVAEVDANLQLI